MPYLPRPDAERTGEDVDEIYALAADELRQAETPEERRKSFRQAILRAYDAGIDAQREIFLSFVHDRPTPVPPPPDEEDPGTLPTERVRTTTPRPFPMGVTHPHEPKKR